MTTDTLLVTGAAGFIGARFVESCGRRGIPVVSVDRSASFTDRPEHRGLDFGNHRRPRGARRLVGVRTADAGR